MIGQGTVEAGTFNQIDWSLGDYHMGIEINTGSGFIDMGTTQLMSVPFALYALNSGTTNNASLPQGNTVGDVLSWNGSAWTVATSNGSTNLPEVNTQAASDITGSSARVEGEFWLDGSSSITAKGVVWSENPEPTVALPTKTDEGPGATNFESQLTGLSPNTTYYYRGYATNAAGTFYGDEQTFTTGEGVVALTTSLVVRDPFPEMSEDMMLDGGAGSGGNISDDDGTVITARGVCWSTLANPTIADSKTEDGTGAGSFSSRLNGLVWNTTYYLRSYATNATGTFYGSEQRFTYPLPFVALSIGGYTAESVQIQTSFIYFEENSIITSGVCWSTSANPTIADNKQENNMGTDYFDTALTELAADTTYYLRSYATTEMGTYYSNEMVFTRPLHGGILTGPDSNDFFNTQEDYESALVDAYHMLRVTFWNVLAATIASDDVIAGGDPYNYDQPTLQRIDKMDQTPADNNQISDIWGFMYEAMDKANYILEFQDKTAFEGKQEVIAQAYFLRAYFAFELTKFFGDIPLLLNEAGTRIQNKRIHTADPFAVNRVGSKANVYELIEADLEEAIGLGLPTSLTNPNEKYITEHAAQALLGKVYLYHGSDDASKFSKAATELNKVIESSKYSLVSAYDNIFSNDNENNAESVFEIQYVSTEGASWSCFKCNKGNYVPKNYAPRSYNGPVYISGWGFGLPTQQLYDSYSNGDTRRDATLFKPNENYSLSRENTGYFIKKYQATKANEATRAGSDPLNYENNYRAIRYADVLLMAAEAEAQSGGNKAVPYLNMVRARAFGDNSHDYPYNGETDLLEAIYKERRLELATEGHRYFDLVRTGKAEEAYEAYNTAISGNGDFEIITFETNKNEVFPIPTLELGLSNAVDRWGQNPGYSMNDGGGNNGGGTDPVGGTITGVDFTIAELNGDGNEVGVTPTSTGGTLYSVDFGDPAAANDEDVIATSGPQVSYTYAKESATYTITVTASASNASDVVATKDHTVTIEDNGGAPAIAGTWKIAPIAGALGVGPAQGDISWWSNSEEYVTTLACLMDDEFVFGADGSFANNMGDATWLEGWQGVNEGCGAPVYPHDGAATDYTYTYDADAGTITLNGVGAHLGLAKVYNGGELASTSEAAGIESITYTVVEISDDGNRMTVDIQFQEGGGYWTYVLQRGESDNGDNGGGDNGGGDNGGGADASGLVGSWSIAAEAGALGVGPAQGDISWWSNSEEDVTTRACFFDDTFVFGADGSFANNMGDATWLEEWQGAEEEGCGAPVSPYDGAATDYTYTYDAVAGTITVYGVGAHLGMSKVYNNGELTSISEAAGIESITYNIVKMEAGRMTVDIQFQPGGGYWTYVLTKN